MKIGTYLFNILVALDQLANTLLAGSPTMTISARMGLAIREGRCRGCRLICRFLDLIDKGHCVDEALEVTETKWKQS